MPEKSVDAGFAHLDDKGRLPIARSVRDSFGLRPGSTVAWVKLGHGFMVIPQDEHLAQVMEEAAVAAVLARPDWVLSTNTEHWNQELARRTGLRVAHPAAFLAGLRA